jgi:hypothetical protein
MLVEQALVPRSTLHRSFEAKVVSKSKYNIHKITVESRMLPLSEA